MSFVAKKKLTMFDYVNYSLLALISIVCLFPFIYVFSVSFTDPKVYIPLKFYLFPDKWSLSAYKYILSTNSFIHALKSTVFITVIGTILNLIVSFSFAYVLTKNASWKKDFIGSSRFHTSVQCRHIAELFAH